MKTPANRNFLRILAVLSSMSLAACIQPTQTGALEEDQLYNTNGLQAGHKLFDSDGLAQAASTASPFVRVGLMWDAPKDTVLEGRFGDGEENWSDWMPIEAYWSEEGAHAGHLNAPENTSQIFQLRVLAGPAPSYLFAEGIDLVAEAIVVEAVEGYGQLEQALAPSSLVNSRSSWGARSPSCSSGSHSIYRATIHHTDTPIPDSITPAARMRQMQDYHMNTKGWCDIGYHFIVDRDGVAWQGRSETVIGAHVLSNNTGNVGISFMGSYNSTSPTQGQMDKVKSLLAWLNSTHSLDLDRSHVKGHREYRGNNAGDCPGDKVYSRIGELLGGESSSPDPDPDPDPEETTPGNGTVQGVVFVDTGVGTSDMSNRISGASVSANGQNTVAGTGDAMWTMSLPAGTYTFAATADGYDRGTRSCTVLANQEVWCSIGLNAGSGDSNPEEDPGEDYDSDSDGSSESEETADPTGVWGGAPGLDDNGQPKGRIYGYVLEMISASDFDQCEGNRVPKALVRSDSGEWVKADDDGLFEIWVPGGAHTLFAKSAGYLDGGWPCTVAPGGETHCCIGLAPETMQGKANDASEAQENMELTGCASAPMNSSAGILPLLLLAGLAMRRRKP